MRQRHSKRQSRSAVGINLTPMVDMMFIMLIFFVVTTSFVRETGVQVNRPSAKTATAQEGGKILVAVRANGEIWMDGRQIDIRTVRENVERQLLENPGSAVVIVADEDSETGLLIQVMDQVKLAGVSNVSIAATKEP